jgi:hypothetical protein
MPASGRVMPFALIVHLRALAALGCRALAGRGRVKTRAPVDRERPDVSAIAYHRDTDRWPDRAMLVRGVGAGVHAPANFIARIASANPRILTTRLRLYARTCKLISAAT